MVIGKIKVIFSISLSFLHYQICALTFILYFNKIMGILPTVKDKFTKRLKWMHFINSFILLVIGGWYFDLTISGDQFHFGIDCALNPYIAFQSVVMISFLMFRFTEYKLRKKIKEVSE